MPKRAVTFGVKWVSETHPTTGLEYKRLMTTPLQMSNWPMQRSGRRQDVTSRGNACWRPCDEIQDLVAARALFLFVDEIYEAKLFLLYDLFLDVSELASRSSLVPKDASLPIESESLLPVVHRSGQGPGPLMGADAQSSSQY